MWVQVLRKCYFYIQCILSKTYTWNPTPNHPRFHFTKGDVRASSEDQEFSRVHLGHWASFLLNGPRVRFSTDCWENWKFVSHEILPLLRWLFFFFTGHTYPICLKTLKGWDSATILTSMRAILDGGSFVIRGANPKDIWSVPHCDIVAAHG